MSIENDKDHEQDGRKRDSRSVDHTRGSYSKTYDQEMKRTTKPSPSNGAGGGKKVNLDVFSLASGGSMCYFNGRNTEKTEGWESFR